MWGTWTALGLKQGRIMSFLHVSLNCPQGNVLPDLGVGEASGVAVTLGVTVALGRELGRVFVRICNLIGRTEILSSQ